MRAETTEPSAPIHQRCVNTVRTLAMDAIQKANSGHPGAPMGLAPAGYVLFTRFLRHNPRNPGWLGRDRLVLSGGHASMLLYSLLYLTGYDLSLDDIREFRQWGSKTPGHPEYGVTPGVETTTGPLGQGLANAVGMAMAERHLAARFNGDGQALADHRTFVICGDGDLMEGISHEAASLAGHLGLGRLVCLYDDNQITIEGSTRITFTENVAARFEAYNWQVLRVEDGNDLAAVGAALSQACDDTERPSLVMLRTHIAYGSPNKQGSADAHGAPLGEEEVCRTKECLGCPPNSTFCVSDEVLAECRRSIDRGKRQEAEWQQTFEDWSASHPDRVDDWVNAISGFLPSGWDEEIPRFGPEDGPLATRAASGKVLNAIAGRLPTLMGGSADLAPSNKTFLDGCAEFQKDNYAGRNIRFGVREHAMAAVMSGMFLHHGIRPYGGTFLVFADYMRPAIRVASLMKLPLIYIFTHDSIAVGEDGPTHQPIEQIASLRAIPGLRVIRPADAGETAAAWRVAVQSPDAPVALVLSRQKLPILAPKEADGGVSQGAYILQDCDRTPEAILLASGSEVHVALQAAERLTSEGVAVRVVSMPSWELFETASQAYRDRVLPPEVKARVAVEAGVALGWHRWVGSGGAVVGIDRFGASAPGSVVMEKFGFTADRVAGVVREILDRK